MQGPRKHNQRRQRSDGNSETVPHISPGLSPATIARPLRASSGLRRQRENAGLPPAPDRKIQIKRAGVRIQFHGSLLPSGDHPGPHLRAGSTDPEGSETAQPAFEVSCGRLHGGQGPVHPDLAPERGGQLFGVHPGPVQAAGRRSKDQDGDVPGCRAG